MDKQMSDTRKPRLIVSKEDDAHELIRLGTVNFDASNRAALSTEGSGPDVEELKSAWQEIAAEPALIWKKTVPAEIDGHKVTRILGQEVKPGEDNYVYAVLNTLERQYGYTVELEE
jgi:hypothetical protein